MKTIRRYIINPNTPEYDKIQSAADIIISGGIVIYPTDTTYAIGANALDNDAVKRVFQLKDRPNTKPIHVIFADLKTAKDYMYFNDNALKLSINCLPGKLTIVLPKKENIPDSLTAGLKTLGFRIPQNSICQLLSKITNIPITTTSANLSGEDPIYSISDLFKTFSNEKLNLIDLILDQGPLERSLPSTVVDMSQEYPIILRKGSFPEEKIFEFTQ